MVRKRVAKRAGAKKSGAAMKALKAKVSALKKEHKAILKKAVAKAYKEGIADGKKSAKKPAKKQRKARAKAKK